MGSVSSAYIVTDLEGVAERVDPFTLRYSGDSFWRIFNHCFYGKPDLPRPE